MTTREENLVKIIVIRVFAFVQLCAFFAKLCVITRYEGA